MSMNKVIDGLYVGGVIGATKENFSKNKITHILAVYPTRGEEEEWAQDFKLKRVAVADKTSTNLTPYFSECVDFIHDCRVNGGAVFVHCVAGVSRSITITVAYLMTVSQLSCEQALIVMKYCRTMANPNLGFRTQLFQYEEELLTVERARLKERFPDSDKLKDESVLKELLTKVSDQRTVSSAQPFKRGWDSGITMCYGGDDDD